MAPYNPIQIVFGNDCAISNNCRLGISRDGDTALRAVMGGWGEQTADWVAL